MESMLDSDPMEPGGPVDRHWTSIGPAWSNMMELTPDGGVKKEVVVEAPEGADSPPDGALVSVHYEGFLEKSGKSFDSSYGRGEPLEFKLGVGQVIKGWDEGLPQMSVGQRAKLTVSSDYAYGEKGYLPVIPPDANLVFDIELISFS